VEVVGNHPNDKSAVALVRIQVILERIYQSPWHGNTETHEFTPTTMFIISSIEQELKRLKPQLADEQSNSGKPAASVFILSTNQILNEAIILMHYHAAEISLYEASLRQSPLFTSSIPANIRIELLCSCLRACKSYFESFLSIPAAEYIALSMASWSHVTHALGVLHILSSLDSPDWNLAYVRDTIEFTAVLGQLIERLDTVRTLAGYQQLVTFSPLAKRMNRVKMYIEEKVASREEFLPGPDPLQMTASDPYLNPGDLSNFFQFLDENWMSDVLDAGPGFPEYQF
jgi:hypothetical protein